MFKFLHLKKKKKKLNEHFDKKKKKIETVCLKTTKGEIKIETKPSTVSY